MNNLSVFNQGAGYFVIRAAEDSDQSIGIQFSEDGMIEAVYVSVVDREAIKPIRSEEVSSSPLIVVDYTVDDKVRGIEILP